MMNHTRISTVSAAVIIVLLFVLFLFINCVPGVRGQDRVMRNMFSREIGEKSSKARDMYMTSGTNDVIHTEDVVSGETEVLSSSRCPTDCTCHYPATSYLLLECDNWYTNASTLSHEINAYLSSVAWNFTQLGIWSSQLIAVPQSVCQLKRLTSFTLNDNLFITSLPDNCFTHLRELEDFMARGCGLTSLQNGLFDNLTKLQSVDFSHNRISSIGAHLFDVAANLPKLYAICVAYNDLTEIDAWPVQRAQLINHSIIDLSYNRISRFTNSLGWHYDCHSAPILSTLIFMKNDIRHLNELFRGWNITGSYSAAFMRS